ncbi:MAG: N-acetyl-gamma-glutamyl-phosphate reductase [Myxococcales bacterium]|nr:MAG: N-acetyl-gamma-glutamyl-phosphate reductase [Myxococcales bacterium]
MSAARLKAVVAGAGGLAAGELLRLLLGHPDIGEVLPLSASQAGRPAYEVHRALRHLKPLTFSDAGVEQAAAGADVVFLAVPHGQSMKVMRALLAAEPKLIIDLSADFRLKDVERFRAAYGEHSCFELAGKFCYGLPEANREALSRCRWIANPGCFATAAELLLLPLAAKKLLPEHIGVFAVTGSSGSGIQPKPGAHHPFRHANLYAYKLLAHQHEPEIAETLSAAAQTRLAPRLLAHSGPFVRGILATAFVEGKAFEEMDVAALYREYYAPHPFVTLLDEPPQAAEVAGTNHVHLHVAQQGGQVALSLALDNLVKGAAGQAIQNMNIARGLPETAGLEMAGSFPC